MSRSAVDYMTGGKEAYKDFCISYPNIKLTIDEWRDIIYSFNYACRDYILETGERIKFWSGFGEFSIIKKKRKTKKKIGDKEYINLPIDWVKTREKGKVIYFMNYHTEGYFFGWQWFKKTARFKFSDLWYFKPSRVSSRLLAHYLKVNDKYQHVYNEWHV